MKGGQSPSPSCFNEAISRTRYGADRCVRWWKRSAKVRRAAPDEPTAATDAIVSGNLFVHPRPPFRGEDAQIAAGRSRLDGGGAGRDNGAQAAVEVLMSIS